VDGNEDFVKFLIKTLNIHKQEWPTVRLAKDALTHYLATVKAVATLEKWEWRGGSKGGFKVPAGDEHDMKQCMCLIKFFPQILIFAVWANATFTVETARLGVFAKHGVCSDDHALFEF
jgi:hypothetical protein